MSVVLFEANNQPFFKALRHEDRFERRQLMTPLALVLLMFAAGPILTITSLVLGNNGFYLVLLTPFVAVLASYTHRYNLRVTSDHIEISRWWGTTRISREELSEIVFETSLRRSRYSTQWERVVIFLDSDGLVLGRTAQNIWGSEVLGRMLEMIEVDTESFDRSLSPQQLEKIYPGLFPLWKRQPMLTFFLTAVIAMGVPILLATILNRLGLGPAGRG